MAAFPLRACVENFSRILDLSDNNRICNRARSKHDVYWFRFIVLNFDIES